MADILQFANNPLGGGIGVGGYQRARAAGLTPQQFAALAGNQGVRLGGQLPSLLIQDSLADLTVQYNGQFQALDQKYQQQAGQQDSLSRGLQAQMQQQQQQFAAQQSQFANLQNAQVPVAEKTAQERRSEGSTATPKKQSGLSSLAIVSGLGTNANPLSGLQLA
jgi:hypothetical protein